MSIIEFKYCKTAVIFHDEVKLDNWERNNGTAVFFSYLKVLPLMLHQDDHANAEADVHKSA